MGLAIALAGIVVYGTFLLLQGTVNPVSMPVSLEVGEVRTPEFRVYKTEYYNLSIEVKKRLSLPVLNCLLGISTGPLDPTNCGEKPALQANWKLWSNGQLVAQGSSKTHRHGGWGNDTVECVFGDFKGNRWQKYVLDVEFERDGTSLRVAEPHLKVSIGPYDEGAVQMNLVLLPLFFVVEVTAVALLISRWRSALAEKA